MIAVTLYTQPGCDLCHEAKAELTALAPQFPHQLIEVNINEDAQLFARYQHLIPVVVIGETRLVYPFSALDLHAALHATPDAPAEPNRNPYGL